MSIKVSEEIREFLVSYMLICLLWVKKVNVFTESYSTIKAVISLWERRKPGNRGYIS